ncbi:MAG: aminotransferase class IV family protein [Chloroflexi bacterium]|nr:aminotransferase class IV family protein [Chloroflexota bacterium]
MSIKLFQITTSGNIPVETHSTTLDEAARELSQGYYTTFSTLGQGTRVAGLHVHLQRLYSPAAEHMLKPSVNEDILKIRIAELARGNCPKESRIRLVLTRDEGVVYIAIQPFKSLPQHVYDQGVRVVTAELARNDPRVKDTGFITESAGQRKRVGGNVFEVLLTRNGRILEGMTSNFYGVVENKLVTARLGILPGVTRRSLLRIARGEGMTVEYRAPFVAEKFDEAFLTSSSRGVVPIVSIDNAAVGQGRVGKWTKMLSKAYQAFVEERSESLLE